MLNVPSAREVRQLSGRKCKKLISYVPEELQRSNSQIQLSRTNRHFLPNKLTLVSFAVTRLYLVQIIGHSVSKHYLSFF